MESQHSSYHHSFSYPPHFYSSIVPREVVSQNWNPANLHHHFHAKNPRTSEKASENPISSMSSASEGISEQGVLENGRHVLQNSKVPYQYFQQQHPGFAANKFYFPRISPFSNVRCAYEESRFEGFKFPWMKNTRSHHYEWKLQWQRGNCFELCCFLSVVLKFT